MIIFYNKNDGSVLSYINGIVHNESDLNLSINYDGVEMDKYIIGIVETSEGNVQHNVGLINIFDEYSPLEYKIINNELVKI